MNQLKNYIINLDKKTLLLIQVFLIIMMTAVYYNTDQKFVNGYHFFFFFLSIVPLDLMIVITMLRATYELDGPPRNPFHLMKYPAYFMMAIFASAPFLYLWSMRDVISQLKW